MVVNTNIILIEKLFSTILYEITKRVDELSDYPLFFELFYFCI